MIIFLRFRCFVIGFFVKIIRFILLDDTFLFFFFFIVRNFLNFEIKNRNFYLSILLPHRQSQFSNYTIVERNFHRRVKILYGILFTKISIFVYLRSLCETRFRVIFHQLETNSIPLSPSYVQIFFFFSILDACASQKHGISLSITILKLYIH